MFLLRGVSRRGWLSKSSGEWGRPMMCNSSSSASSSGASGGGEQDEGETIIDRLRRLSVTPCDEFEPSPGAAGEGLEKAKGRYRRILQEYEGRFAMKQAERYRSQRSHSHRHHDQYDDSDFRRRRNDSWGGGGGGGGVRGGYNNNSWRSSEGFGQFREMSTMASEKRMISVSERLTGVPSSPVVAQQQQQPMLGDKKQKKDGWRKNVDGGSGDRKFVEGRGRRRDDLLVGGGKKADEEGRNNRKTESSSSADESSALSRVAAGGDANTFGTLGGGVLWKDVVGVGIEKELQKEQGEVVAAAAEIEDDDDVSFYPLDQKWTMAKLSQRVKELADAKKVDEAVSTLEGALSVGGFHYVRGDMVYLYNVCISLCGGVGHVDLAFRLFNDMKKRGFPPKPSTYTSLFNACANGVGYKPREEILERLERLRGLMGEKGVVPNQLNYHSMMKAYGRCGDLVAVFSIVDEMSAAVEGEGVKPNTETFNFLLQACLSDTAGGFRHALVTWRKMNSLNHIRPDLFSYNLLLRVARECGVSSSSSSGGPVVQQRGVNIKKPEQNKWYVPPVQTEEEADEVLKVVVSHQQQSSGSNRAALLEVMRGREQQQQRRHKEESSSVAVPRTGEELVAALGYPENRLAVLGGLRGLFSQMAQDRVGPNLKTLTELAQIIHPTEATDLLVLLKVYKLSPFLDMFNVLMKRCYVLGYAAQAKSLLRLLPSFNLTPNIVTWGVCALGCESIEDATNLLNEMDKAQFTPNVEVMGALLCSATGGSCDPEHVLFVMEEARRREVAIDGKFVLQVEAYNQKMRRAIVHREIQQQQQTSSPSDDDEEMVSSKLERVMTSPGFGDKWGRFAGRLKFFLRKATVNEEPRDPWADHFRQYIHNKKNKRDGDDYADMFPLKKTTTGGGDEEDSLGGGEMIAKRRS